MSAAAPSRVGVLEPMFGVVYPNPADLALLSARRALRYADKALRIFEKLVEKLHAEGFIK